MKRDHPKTGRNEPCHCGSALKYKKCHYDADRLRESAELAALIPQFTATPLGGGMYEITGSLDGSVHDDCPICQAKTPAERVRLIREMSGERTH